MSKKSSLNEKSFEMLFNRFFGQAMGLRNIIIYAPTTKEEYNNGYDSAFLGFSSASEIYLQFKSPLIYKYNKRIICKFTLTPHQHKVLRDYPDSTAYYVVHCFSTSEEAFKIQKKINEANDFLKHSFCIDAKLLPKNAHHIYFSIPETGDKVLKGLKYNIKKVSHRSTYKDAIQVENVTLKRCFRGSTLATKFRDQEVGTNFTYHIGNNKNYTPLLKGISPKVGYHVSESCIKKILSAVNMTDRDNFSGVLVRTRIE